MPKKTLNLQIVEFEQLAESRDSISLMPCPCGASGGGYSRPSPKPAPRASRDQEYFSDEEIEALYNAFSDVFPEAKFQMGYFIDNAVASILGPQKGFELEGGVQNIGGIGTGK